MWLLIKLLVTDGSEYVHKETLSHFKKSIDYVFNNFLGKAIILSTYILMQSFVLTILSYIVKILHHNNVVKIEEVTRKSSIV